MFQPLPHASEYLATFQPKDKQLLYRFWGARHEQAQTDPLAIKRLPYEEQAMLAQQFKRYLTSDEGLFGVYSDGKIGWDSLDQAACSARVVYHFLRSRFDATRKEEK